jgi:hypothetical protein
VPSPLEHGIAASLARVLAMGHSSGQDLVAGIHGALHHLSAGSADATTNATANTLTHTVPTTGTTTGPTAATVRPHEKGARRA